MAARHCVPLSLLGMLIALKKGSSLEWVNLVDKEAVLRKCYFLVERWSIVWLDIYLLEYGVGHEGFFCK